MMVRVKDEFLTTWIFSTSSLDGENTFETESESRFIRLKKILVDSMPSPDALVNTSNTPPSPSADSFFSTLSSHPFAKINDESVSNESASALPSFVNMIDLVPEREPEVSDDSSNRRMESSLGLVFFGMDLSVATLSLPFSFALKSNSYK